LSKWSINLTIETLSQGILNGFVSSGIYILVALGLTICISIINIVQLAHGEVYMIGAYVVYSLFVLLHVNYIVSLLAAVLIVGGIGIVIERLFFRPLRGQMDRSLIVAVGLILILQNIVLSIAGGNPKSYLSPFSGVLQIFNVSMSWERLITVVIGFTLVAALFIFIKFTRMGQAMLAISQDRVGAGLQGINIDRLSAIAMFLASGLAALAGGLVGALFSISPTMGGFALMKGIAVIILGGLGSIPGAVIGGLIIGMIDGILPVATTTYTANIFGFVIIMVILIFRPQGIWGRPDQGYDEK
jgi:branched-chain amino acid transport system permease protein